MLADKNQISIGKYTIKFSQDSSVRGKALTVFSWCLIAQIFISIAVSFYYLWDKFL